MGNNFCDFFGFGFDCNRRRHDHRPYGRSPYWRDDRRPCRSCKPLPYRRGPRSRFYDD